MRLTVALVACLGGLLAGSPAWAVRPRPRPPVQQPKGDFVHTPPTMQKVGLPVPIYVEYLGVAKVVRVSVKYRIGASAEWKRLELKRMGSGYGGLVPCEDVSGGTLSYWLVGFDDGGDTVATGGDATHAYTVPIRPQMKGEAPHLPGRPPPTKCEGEATERTAPEPPKASPVVEERAAVEERPSEPEKEHGDDSHAPKEDEPPTPGGYARLWVGISGTFELVPMPEGDDVCQLNQMAGPSTSVGYYCTNPDGTDFPSRSSPAQNAQLLNGQSGHIDSGLRVGDVRALLAVDYALSQNLLLGMRGGYVLNAYPGQDAAKDGRAFGSRLHLEGRATYVFGREPLGGAGLAPTVFAGAGIGEFDGHATTAVTLSGAAAQQPESVWLTDGPFFVVVGGGLRYQLSRRAAFVADVRVNGAVGASFLLTFGPEIAIMYGF